MRGFRLQGRQDSNLQLPVLETSGFSAFHAGRLIALIDSPEPAVALKAATALLDRILGSRGRRSSTAARWRMAQITAQAPLARAKLDELIKRKAETIAANGHVD